MALIDLMHGQVLVAESYGGRDEPVDTLIGNCLNANADTTMQPLRVRDTPTESTYQVCSSLLAQRTLHASDRFSASVVGCWT